MSKSEKDLEIVSELAKEIAEENDSAKTQTSSGANNSDESLTDHSKAVDADLSQDDHSANHTKKRKKFDKDKPTPTLKELAAKKQNQNLAERKILLVILAVLLGIQLLFMNAVVLLIVLWSLFDWEFFRELDTDVLKCILDFTKYYVTAVLVELLGGIIYIVHRVFSDKS